LCRGTGSVPPGVAEVYNRDESKPTKKLTQEHVAHLRELSSPWPSEAPTRPEVIKRAEKIRRGTFWGMILAGTMLVGVLVGVATHC
jgi:hypothetical protein